MSKIIIFGFPHCGTSILKSITGHIPDVEEVVAESLTVGRRRTDKKYILCKYPYTRNEFFGPKYADYIKIFIIRNPAFVYTSLNKRFGSNEIPKQCAVTEYIRTLEKFRDCARDSLENVHLIRYEDMFDDGHKQLKEIFDRIGLVYDDDIFNNESYHNRISPSVRDVPTNRPPNRQHLHYRTYQINQPFINNNKVDEVDITDEQRTLLRSNPTVCEFYPEIMFL